MAGRERAHAPRENNRPAEASSAARPWQGEAVYLPEQQGAADVHAGSPIPHDCPPWADTVEASEPNTSAAEDATQKAATMDEIRGWWERESKRVSRKRESGEEGGVW